MQALNSSNDEINSRQYNRVSSTNDFVFKILLLGDQQVGKSSILRRLVVSEIVHRNNIIMRMFDWLG